MKLPQERVPVSIDRYGNTSSASIPLTLVAEWRERLSTLSMKLVMAGFGAGYSWATAAVELGPLACARLVEV